MTTLLVIFVLGVMWAAVLLPPYLRDRQGVKAAHGGPVSERVNALTSSLRPGGAHLPVHNSGAAPTNTPLPAGARHPIGQTGGPVSAPPRMPQSSAVMILGKAGEDPDTQRPRLHAVTDEEAARLAIRTEQLEPQVVSAPVVEDAAPSNGSARAKQRRKDVLQSMAGVAVLTLLAALALGGPMFYVHLLADAALAGYVYLLVGHRKNQAEAEIKVAFLPHGGEGADARTLLADGGGFRPGTAEEVRVFQAKAN